MLQHSLNDLSYEAALDYLGFSRNQRLILMWTFEVQCRTMLMRTYLPR